MEELKYLFTPQKFLGSRKCDPDPGSRGQKGSGSRIRKVKYDHFVTQAICVNPQRYLKICQHQINFIIFYFSPYLTVRKLMDR